MSVIDFPGRQRPPPAGDVWDPRTRALDQQYILEVLKRRLPPEALRHVAGLDLASIASAVLLEVDTVRHERRFTPRYDEERAGGELGALDRLVGDPPPQPEPPDCA